VGRASNSNRALIATPLLAGPAGTCLPSKNPVLLACRTEPTSALPGRTSQQLLEVKTLYPPLPLPDTGKTGVTYYFLSLINLPPPT
jgi:hypothetical protein